MVTACFSKHGSLLPIALSFFIGCDYYTDEYEEENELVTLKQLTKDSKVMQVAKRRGKRQRQFERQVAGVKKRGREKKSSEYSLSDLQNVKQNSLSFLLALLKLS